MWEEMDEAAFENEDEGEADEHDDAANREE